MKIYLARHGQTAWNHQRRYQGSQDIPLDDDGVFQAQCLAERLKLIEWSGAVSSDLIRAEKTAKIVLGDQCQLPLHIYPELREMNFGIWEGITFTEANEKWPDKVRSFFADPTQPIIPEGENALQFQDRVMEGLDRILEMAKDGENWFVATHGGAIRVILCKILGLPLKEMWNMEQGNTALNILSVQNNKMSFELINDISHLEMKKGS